MASRIDSSQNRNLYVGTGTEVAVNDGNAIVTGNVGIGTTSPQQKLDTPNIIISGSSIAASYRANATLMDNLGGVARFYSLGADTSTGGSYQFNSLSSNATAGSGTVMTILNNGNVGIGTTSPSYKLQIGVAGGLADSIRIGSYAVAKDTRQYIGYARANNGLFESSGDGDTPSTVMAGVAGIRIVNTTGTLSSGQADNSVQLLTHIYNGGSRVALHANYNGNVGIGTTSPDAKLSVVGSGENGGIFFNNSGAQEHRFYSSANSQFNTIGSSSPIWNWAQHTGVGVTPNYKMTLNNTGLGIGTTSPNYKLDVNGIIRSEDSSEVGTLYLGNTAQSEIPGGAIIGQRSSYSSTGKMEFQVPTWGANTDYGLTTQMTIEVNTSDTKEATISMIPFGGKVGIGTTSPASKLQVSGSGNESVEIKVSGGTTAGNTGSISLSRTDGGGSIIQGAAFLSGGVPIGGIAGGVVGSSNTSAPAFAIQTPNSANGHIVFNPKGTEKMRIEAGGNVGIGTTNPTSPLEISGAGSDGNAILRLNSTAGGNTFNWISSTVYPNLLAGRTIINLFGKAQSTNNQAYIGFKYAGSGYTSNMLTLGFYANDFLVNILASGNVGIGTTSPDKLLHVGDGSATLSAPQGAEIEGYNNTLDVKTNEANNISDFTPAINLFCDGVTGSSGTGTGIYFRAQTGGGGGGEYTKGRIQGAVYTSWTTNTDATRTSKLVIQTTNSGTHADRVTILGNGDFGINDTSPSNKLDVNGDIRGTQYKLRGNVSNPTSTAATIYDQSGVGLTLSAHNVELRNYNGSSMVRSVFFTHNTATFTGTCTATNFILSSDEILKDNIKNIDNKHIDVDWKNFELKSEPGVKRSGVIAQELEKKHPEFVRTNKDGLKSVAYIDLLIAKIAELEARLEKAGI